MCVLFVYVKRDPSSNDEYKLILVSNRDELFKRPASDAGFWKNSHILAGKDLTPGKEGGTWLGTSRNGRVAVLLNDARKVETSDCWSRGPLVAGYLEAENPKKHLDGLVASAVNYNPFQLVTCDLSEKNVILRHFSNLDKRIVDFEDGVYGFSNGSLELPYKKASFGKKQLSEIVEKYGKTTETKETLVQNLLDLLRNTETHMPDPNLEKLSGKPEPIVTALSAINVRLAEEQGFGTRTNTVILVDGRDNIDFFEWSHDMDATSPNHFSFTRNS